MLVLVSFGLVLLATILLVVGLLSDDGINLIYLSIGASATAAVVLFVAFRMARPKAQASKDRPAPLAEDLAPADVADRPEPEPVAPAPTTVSSAISATPEPVPAPTSDDWADDADWETDDAFVDFPIADYDDLTVAEILPLLPQLYSDELDVVHERERSSKNRASILAELDRLKQTGTEADALEQAAGLAPAPEPQPAPAPEPAPAVEPAPAPAPPRTSLLDDDDDDGAFFPIADYDDLSVSQIVPLLPQLELDELRDVRAAEVAGANRTTLVAEIDRYLSGELEAYVFDDEPVDEEPVIDPEAARLPIADYPQLDVSEVVARLDGLTPAQIEQIAEYEAARDNRSRIMSEAQRRLDEAAPAAPTRPRPARKTATRKKATQKKATKKAAPKKSTTKKSTTKKATKKASARTKKSTAKKAARANSFPIVNYDELSVAVIRPQLAGLSAAELEQVRSREESGAVRKTILNDIAKRLGN